MLLTTVNQCCQLLWLQQREMMALRSTVHAVSMPVITCEKVVCSLQISCNYNTAILLSYVSSLFLPIFFFYLYMCTCARVKTKIDIKVMVSCRCVCPC
jgi:hypothetical protein